VAPADEFLIAAHPACLGGERTEVTCGYIPDGAPQNASSNQVLIGVKKTEKNQGLGAPGFWTVPETDANRQFHH